MNFFGFPVAGAIVAAAHITGFISQSGRERVADLLESARPILAGADRLTDDFASAG